MIILSHRVKPGAVAAVAAHVLHGFQNDVVEVLLGSVERLEKCVSDARSRGLTYAVRHIKISPAQQIDNAQAKRAAQVLANEFAFRLSTATMVRHGKPRYGIEEEVDHFHLLVPEYDPEHSASVLSSSHSYARQEKCSRVLEFEFGHRFVPGAHHRAVIRGLEKDGRHDVADAIRYLEPAREPAEPATSYDAGDAAQIERAGLHPAETIERLREAYALAASGTEFRAMIADHGLTIGPGQKRATTPCVYWHGEHVASLPRALSAPIVEVRAFLATGSAPEPQPREPDHRPPVEAAPPPQVAQAPRGAGPLAPAPAQAPPVLERPEPAVQVVPQPVPQPVPPPCLTPEEVEAEISAILNERRPQQHDRTALDRLKREASRTSQAEGAARAKERAEEASVAAAKETAGRYGWLARTCWPWAGYRRAKQTLAQAEERLGDAKRSTRTAAEANQTAMRARNRVGDRIAALEASDQERLAAAERRIERMREAIAQTDAVFPTRAALRAWITRGLDYRNAVDDIAPPSPPDGGHRM